MKPKFVEMEPLIRHELGPLVITPFPALHTVKTNPMSLRVEVAGKVISYTGDLLDRVGNSITAMLRSWAVR